MKKTILMSVIASSLLTTSAYAEISLGNIIVTTKTNTEEKDTATSISVVTAEDIKRTNASTLRDALKSVPGIDLGINSSSISGRRNVSIRGSASEQVLILVDGMKVSGSDAQIGHSDFQYNWVPMDSIERIEVTKGPLSSLYGSQAIGGVINIITKKFQEETYEVAEKKDSVPVMTTDAKGVEIATAEVIPVESRKVTKRFSGGIDIMAGSGDDGKETRASLSLMGKVSDKLSMSLSVEKYDREASSEWVTEMVMVRTPKGPVVKKKTYEATKLTEKDVLSATVTAKYDIDETQSISASYTAGREDRLKANDVLYYDLERTNYSVGYNKSFDTVSLSAQYYVTDSDSHINTFKNNYTHNMTDTVVKAEAMISALDNHFIVIGAENKKEEYDKVYDSAKVNAKAGFTDEVTTNAFYIQDEISVAESLLVTLGGRYDDHDKFGGNFSPSAGLVFKLGDKHRLKASYGEGFRSPTLTQGSSAYLVSHGPRFQFRGNDDLKPETSKSMEVGYGYYGDQTTFKATAFKRDTEDLITTKMINRVFVYSNVNKTNAKGAELELDYKLSDNTGLNLSYSYLKTEDEKTGKEIERKPKSHASLTAYSQLAYGIKSSISVLYTGKQRYSDTVRVGKKSVTVYGDYEPFTTVDMLFSKDLSTNLNLRLGVENLTDEQLEDHDPYAMRGRFAYVGLNYKF